MPIGLSRIELETVFNEHLKTYSGQWEALQGGENPTIAKAIEEYRQTSPTSSEEFRQISIFIGMAVGAILDTIADNNKAI